MRVRALVLGERATPTEVTVDMTIEEAILIAKYVGSLTPSKPASTAIWDALNTSVFVPFWDDGLTDASRGGTLMSDPIPDNLITEAKAWSKLSRGTTTAEIIDRLLAVIARLQTEKAEAWDECLAATEKYRDDLDIAEVDRDATIPEYPVNPYRVTPSTQEDPKA